MVCRYNHLISLPLQEAIKVLKNKCIKVKTLETYPPGKTEGKGIKRVLALHRGENTKTINIIWSYELYF